MPLQQAATSLTEWLEGIYGYIYKYDQLVEENESLRRQLSEAQEAARAARRNPRRKRPPAGALGLS
jgi:cell shape-determining protein MreC